MFLQAYRSMTSNARARRRGGATAPMAPALADRAPCFVLLLVVWMSLSGCQRNMVDQPRVDGIRRELELPKSGSPEHLPHSLPEALDHLAASETVAGWFGPIHFDAYMRFKRVEAEKVAGLSPAELCARYAEVY